MTCLIILELNTRKLIKAVPPETKLISKNKNPMETKIIPENMKEIRALLEMIPDWVFDKIGKNINEIEK